ncbi:hypothetical protein, partial [Faecalicatena contorta]|uniref:hypothetical protein n=1 Tax=Faecalicatena contorta TaxID=39482 RepID=UPI001F433FE2
MLLDERLAIFMTNTAYDYVMHEKSLLERENDFLGEKYDAEKKFELIGELIALIYIEAVTGGIVESIRQKIDLIKEILVAHNVPTEALNMVEAIENKKYNLCMDMFENAI